MIKKYGDVYAGIFLMVFAVIIYAATYSFQRLTVSQIGSEFVPRLVAIGIFLLSLLLLINGINHARQNKADHAAKEHTSEPHTAKKSIVFNHGSFPVVATIVLLILYIALIREIGFLIMTTVYLVLQFYILAGKSQRHLPLFLTLSIAVSVSVYYVFRYGFNLMLPAGIFG